MGSHRHGIAFLLSLGGLPISCAPSNPVIPDDGDDTTGTTASVEPTSTTTGFLDDTGASATTGASETTGATPPEHAPCLAYYDKTLECLPREGTSYAARLAAYCEDAISAGLASDGQPCVDAVGVLYVCLSNLSCALLFSDDAPHCVAEGMAAADACPLSMP